jgi:proteic killer suppression protein
MIISFGDKDTGKIWNGERVKRITTEIQEMARRKLRMLNNSQNLADLQVPALKQTGKTEGKLKGLLLHSH